MDPMNPGLRHWIHPVIRNKEQCLTYQGPQQCKIEINSMSYEHLGKLHICYQCQIRQSVYVDPLIRNPMTGVEHIRLPLLVYKSLSTWSDMKCSCVYERQLCLANWLSGRCARL